MTTCRGCGSAGQPEGARFCFSCGAGLQEAVCGSCAAEIVPGARFCSNCGAVQAEPAASAGASQPVASRRITSVLFGDLVGFTSLSETRDQEEVRELLSRYFEECRQIISRYGGTVEKFIGDAVMAVWGVPTTHEDDAERAVRAGLELVNTIAAMGADLAVPDLAMRVGIVTGEVAVTVGAEHQGMVAGDAVNTASRVQSVAAPGQVWVDETTRLLTTSAINYVDVGSHAMKGKADPVPLWSVRAVVAAVGGAQRADGLEAPHVGRDRELRLVKELFHGVEETRHPALLVVDGEPGVGKSRLGWEFEKYSDGLHYGIRWHSGRCLSYGEGVAFYALAEAIRGRLQTLLAADDDPGDSDEDQARLLTRGLETHVPDLEERAWLAPRMEALLGIGAVGNFKREDLFVAWTTFLQRVSEDKVPVVLMIDDGQHADDGLLHFIEHLLAVGSFPCFVLLLSRPGLLEEHPTLATNRRATVLHLEPLTPRDMGELLDGLVVGLPDAARNSLVERAEGVPLFAVETVRSLIDRDLVVPRGGQYVLADAGRLDLDAIGAPASLQALISARLDTLPGDERRVLDRACVVGTSFDRDAIAALCPDVAELEAALAGLVRLQLLRQESNRFSSEIGQYQFVQTGVRQVAYGTLSRRDRKATHLAVVRVLEARDNSAGEISPIIAQHCLEAIDAVPDAPDLDELSSAAVTHLQRAAARASALGAPEESAAHLTSALERCTDPAVGARIEYDLAAQLRRAGRHVDALEHARRARDAFDALGDEVQAGRAVAVLALALTWGLADYEQALAVARERYDALRGRDDAGQAEMDLSNAMLGALLRSGGDVREVAEQSARLADRVGDESDVADSYISLGLHYTIAGPRRLGRILLEAAADLARSNHDNRTLIRALTNLNADWTQDDVARASELGRESIEVGHRLGDRSWTSAALVNLIIAMYPHGDWDEALAWMGEDELEPLDFSFGELVRCNILRARGEPWEPAAGLGAAVAEDDTANQAACRLIEGNVRLRGGDAAAATAEVIAGIRQYYGLSGTSDDFTWLWLTATELVWEAGDRAGLTELFDVVEQDQVNKRPVGLRAQQARMRGLMAIEDGAGSDVVEAHLRAAIVESRAWGSPVTEARSQADLGAWLTRTGRGAEATELLTAARATYDRLGAVRWTEALDAALAGVTA